MSAQGCRRAQAQEEGLADIFINAGFEWRQSGCSMCLAMNDDVLNPGDRCASSTNRNFEGRQGAGVRTHLMSPAMVAAAAIKGHLEITKLLYYHGGAHEDVRKLNKFGDSPLYIALEHEHFEKSWKYYEAFEP